MKYFDCLILKEIGSKIQIKDREEEIDVTILKTRKANVHRSISIVKESDTDPENEASQRKLQCARVIPCRRRATPITIISVGVNETTGGRGWRTHRDEEEMRTRAPERMSIVNRRG